MGNAPLESEIPVEISDFPDEIQLSFVLYSYLSDRWDTMSGTYMGKDLSDMSFILSVLEIPESEYRIYLEFIKRIDEARKTQIAENIKNKPKAP